MFGQFGATISEALSTEFFQWFHLKKTGESHDAGLILSSYQPTAPQFHDLVRVTLAADATESLGSVQLSLQRSFIDSSQHFTLAADISKSFLAAALNPDDMSTMHSAMAQIRAYKPASSAMAVKALGSTSAGGDEASADEQLEAMKRAIDSGQPVYATMKSFKPEGGKMVPAGEGKQGPLLPGEGEPAYLAYTGKRRRLEQRLAHNLLQMDNGNSGGTEQLIISVRPL